MTDPRFLEAARALLPGFPCGWPRPEVACDERTGAHYVAWEGVGELEPDEARGVALALLLAAEECER